MNLKPAMLLFFLLLQTVIHCQEIGYTELFDMLANVKTEEFKGHLAEKGFELMSKVAGENSTSRIYTYAYSYNMETKYADAWILWEIDTINNTSNITFQYTDSTHYQQLKKNIEQHFSFLKRDNFTVGKDRTFLADKFEFEIENNYQVKEMLLNTRISAYCYQGYNSWFLTIDAVHRYVIRGILEPDDDWNP